MLHLALPAQAADSDVLLTVPELVGPRLRYEVPVGLVPGATCDGAPTASLTVVRGDVPVLVVAGEGPATWRALDGTASGETVSGMAVLPHAAAEGTARYCVQRGSDATLVEVTAGSTPYTQVALHDLRADGTAQARTLTTEVVGATSVTHRRWMTSDFIHVDQVFDSDGAALPVDITHNGAERVFLYDAKLATPAGPGSLLLLDSRGWTGAFAVHASSTPDVYAYEFVHAPNAAVTTRRVDVFVLPAGAQLIDAPEFESRERNGRTELVRRTTIPPGGHVALRFTYRLAGAALAVGPHVVATNPASGAIDVDPKLRELRVTFDRDMADGSWSFVTSDDGRYPKTKGAPWFADPRTCVLPVRLKPDTAYALWINRSPYMSFHAQDGTPTEAYELRFHTSR